MGPLPKGLEVLSIGKLVSGAEDYYLKTVARGAEEYYLGAGEAPGRWMGSGCEGLGLGGVVGAAQLRALLAGFSSAGERITNTAPGRARVAGFDLCFSAPKSVSVLWGLGEEAVAGAVRVAHDGAVEEALGYLERHATRARRGAGGAHRIEAKGLVGAAFRHRTSRAGDPQLHSHVLVANAVEGADGAWSAPDARLIYFHARTAGALYQAALRARLTAALGVRFGAVRNGCAEIAGVEEGLITLFSTRREQVEAALEHRGASSRKAAELAALSTRPAKTPVGELPSGQSLQQLWRAQARGRHLEPERLAEVLGPPRLMALDPGLPELLAEQLLGSEGLTASSSTFEPRDVARSIAEALEEGASVAAVEELSAAVLQRREALFLVDGGRGGEGLWSTEEMLEIERRLLDESERQRGARRAVGDEALTEVVIAQSAALTEEQKTLVRGLLGSGHGVEAVVGKAGSGKTQAFAAARAAWEQAGLSTMGVALSARAAAELQAQSGIFSDTVAGLLARVGRGEQPLAGTDVLVVDEAGMIGTRDMWRLVQAASATQTKIVLVGDHRQLPEIDAGGAFSALVGKLHGLQLRANLRQEAAWEKEALDQLRAGRVEEALESYRAMGRLQLTASATEARSAMVEDWARARGEGGVTMLAARRADVEELNRLARQRLRATGKLGEDVAVADGRGFAVGDEVICLKNDRGLGVRNGTRGTVLSAEDEALVIECSEGQRRLDHGYLEAGGLAHGYATTIHKAQGATFDRALVLASGGLYREAGYVAMSRARTRSELYVVEGFDLDGAGGEGEEPGALDDLSRELSASRAKQLASSYLPGDPEERGLGRELRSAGRGIR